jgi:hypothetical protein
MKQSTVNNCKTLLRSASDIELKPTQTLLTSSAEPEND